MTTAAFLHRLPKTETHLHLEGALPWALLQSLDPVRFRAPPPWWAPDFRYPSFENFESILIEHALLWYTSAARYHEAARHVFAGLAAQNVRYVETSFHLGILELLDIPGPAIVEAIQSAAPPGLEVRVFVGMLRRHYQGRAAAIIDSVHTWPGLSGLDLHGVETWPLESWTERVWARARDAGLELKAHAGEFGGPAAVREAVERLGVRRIQHGVQAVADPAVVALLVARGVTCDVTPLSNVKLRVVPSLAAHPLRALLDAGVRCTLSTDDPFSFGNTLTGEYEALAAEAGFSRSDLVRLARHGFEVALVAPPTRARWLAELAAAAA